MASRSARRGSERVWGLRFVLSRAEGWLKSSETKLEGFWKVNDLFCKTFGRLIDYTVYWMVRDKLQVAESSLVRGAA